MQVVLLKEERSNLLSENEELYGKVREAQTLSRKDSVKAKQMETEVDHLKDEFDRLRLLYESIREYMDSVEVERTTNYFRLDTPLFLLPLSCCVTAIVSIQSLPRSGSDLKRKTS